MSQTRPDTDLHTRLDAASQAFGSHDAPGHQHDDDIFADGIPHVSARDYLTGFVLSVVLTAIPFALVMGKVFASPIVLTVVLLAFAAVQVVVHMVYFLHMNTKSEGGWNVLALIFTLVLVVIVLTGSLWVMHHLNSNMMPGVHAMPDMLQTPP